MEEQTKYVITCSDCNKEVKEEDKYCPNCGSDLSEVVIDESDLFDYELNPRFCQKCLDETTYETIGEIESVNLIGTTLFDLGHSCKICNSKVVKKCWILFGFPIKSYGYFRVIKLQQKYILIGTLSKYLSRKIKNQKQKYSFWFKDK